jgi:endonuclease III
MAQNKVATDDLKIKVKTIIKELRRLYPDPKIELVYSNPWELFVAVVLSAQTTDKKVNEVTKKVFKKYKKLSDYTNTSLDEFQHDIKSIGLYKNKGKNIKAAAEIILEKYNGRVPDTMDELTGLPGVGRKTANILLTEIYGKAEGIAVDTHVKRLSLLFGLTREKDPNKIEKDLMEIVPREEWLKFNHAVVLYGRYNCTARCNHKTCPLKNYISA